MIVPSAVNAAKEAAERLKQPSDKPKPPFAVLCKFGLHQRETVYDRPSQSLLKCKRCGAE